MSVKRPTIPDLAMAAGVSVSTVNRVINQGETVRQATRQRVLIAAEEIGFYGLGSIEHSVLGGREKHCLAVLLLSAKRRFYRNLGASLEQAARNHMECKIDLTVRYLEDLTPDYFASQIKQSADESEAVAIVAPQHPFIADAVDAAMEKGVPVLALICPFTAKGNVSFIGLDNLKVGRTAAWTFDKLVREPGKIGVLIGNHRFRNQELNESGFRSYFREHNNAFTVLEPLSTYESAAIAQEHVELLFKQHPDLCGLYVSGGGITGALSALRQQNRRDDFVAVGYELFDETRTALVEGTLNLVISHPIENFARKAIATMISSKKAGLDAGAQRVALNFEIYTPENI